MALTPCPECKASFSSLAVVCPFCGASRRAGGQGAAAAETPSACPVCGRRLPPRATICLDCNVNVRTGKPLALPSPNRTQRSLAGVALGLAVMIAMVLAVGYRERAAIQALVRARPVERIDADFEPSGPETSVVPAGPGVEDRTAAARPAPTPPSPVEPLIERVDEPLEPAPPPAEPPVAEPDPGVSSASVPSAAPAAPSARRPAPHARPVPAAAQPRERARAVRVTCPLCKGQSELPEPGSQRWTYRCPLCHGRGAHEVSMTQAQALCPACGGMGQTAALDTSRKTRQRYVAVRCQACRGTGAR